MRYLISHQQAPTRPRFAATNLKISKSARRFMKCRIEARERELAVYREAGGIIF
jgi:hypothetical protein